MDNTPAVKTHSLAHQIFYGEHLRYFCQEGRIMLGKNWPYPKLLFFFQFLNQILIRMPRWSASLFAYDRIWDTFRHIYTRQQFP